MIFEKASRKKIRFNTPKGVLSVEDLWDMPLTSTKKNVANLDDLAKILNKELRDSNVESFVVETSSQDEELKLKFELVKHVIDVRKEENKNKKKQSENLAYKQRLAEIIEKKESESLESLSVEELKKKLAEVD